MATVTPEAMRKTALLAAMVWHFMTAKLTEKQMMSMKATTRGGLTGEINFLLMIFSKVVAWISTPVDRGDRDVGFRSKSPAAVGTMKTALPLKSSLLIRGSREASLSAHALRMATAGTDAKGGVLRE